LERGGDPPVNAHRAESDVLERVDKVIDAEAARLLEAEQRVLRGHA
jgi:hypothetical protein